MHMAHDPSTMVGDGEDHRDGPTSAEQGVRDGDKE